jgi:heat shock protein HtpX
MLGSYGLKTYIWNNRLKSLLLLAGFPVLLLLVCFGFALLIAALNDPTVGDGIRDAIRLVPSLIPVALIGAGIWFVIAWFANQGIVDAVTGARRLERTAEPRVWNLLENLCISRGITMPRLRVIETDARNAFASGVRKNQYSITVTRGLIDALDDAELEAVLGHELTHIENRDVQLMVVAAVFVGIISLAGDLLVRSPRVIFSGGGRSSRRGGKDGGGAIVIILIAIAIFIIARLLGLALSFAMSRKREFLADAGSVELTKNPDAMISALRKIAGHSEIHAPAQIQEMFLDHPRADGLSSLFATHPSIDSRVEALERYAGGREQASAGPALPAATPPGAPDFGKRVEPPVGLPGAPPAEKGPWG